MENMKIIKCMPSEPLVIHWCICSFSNRLFHPYFSQLKLKPAIYKSRDLGCDCKLKVRKFYVLLILECGGRVARFCTADMNRTRDLVTCWWESVRELGQPP